MIGTDEIYKNLIVLSAVNAEQVPQSIAELELGIHAFLRDYQPKVPRLDYCGTQLLNDRKIEDQLTELFSEDSFLNDKEQASMMESGFSEAARIHRQAVVQAALDDIKTKMPAVYAIFQLSIDTLFFRDSKKAGGGSTSNAIRAIWVNGRASWHLQDMTEFLFHELVHNLVFFDELRYSHFYDYRLLKPEENYAQSALLRARRPLDKVFHSLIVTEDVVNTGTLPRGAPKQVTLMHPPRSYGLRRWIH